MNYFNISLSTAVFAFFLGNQLTLNAIPSLTSSTTESYLEEKTPQHSIEHHLTKDYLFGIPFLITDKAISHYILDAIGANEETQAALNLCTVINTMQGQNFTPKVNVDFKEAPKTTLTWQGHVITSSLFLALYCAIIYYTHDPLKPVTRVPLIITF